jgi:hypothetical protein
MKTIIAASLLALASSAALATDVGVSISVGQPNFYGQINIGDFPQPSLVYAQPVMIERRSNYGEPMYLRVPPGHAKHWAKHCRAYNACGRQVYFVQDSWYLNQYAPQYRAKHGEGHGRGNDHGDHGDRGDRGDRGDDRGDDRGHGNGHGNGHGKGHDKN